MYETTHRHMLAESAGCFVYAFVLSENVIVVGLFAFVFVGINKFQIERKKLFKHEHFIVVASLCMCACVCLIEANFFLSENVIRVMKLKITITRFESLD